MYFLHLFCVSISVLSLGPYSVVIRVICKDLFSLFNYALPINDFFVEVMSKWIRVDITLLIIMSGGINKLIKLIGIN